MEKLVLDDLIENVGDYRLLVNEEGRDHILELENNETIESEVENIIATANDAITTVFVIDKARKFITYTLYSEEKGFLQFRNLEEFTNEEGIEGMAYFIQEVLDSFNIENLGVLEEIDLNKYRLLNVRYASGLTVIK